MRSEFGQRLRTARTRAGMTQSKIAELVGMKQATYSELEKIGQGSAFTPAIADKFGVAVNWLAYGAGEMLPATATVNITAPSPTLVATVSASKQPISSAVPAQVATNSVALSVECQVLCNAMAGLPDDHALRTRVLSDLLSIIAKAHDPPSHQESPAYSHAATRAA